MQVETADFLVDLADVNRTKTRSSHCSTTEGDVLVKVEQVSKFTPGATQAQRGRLFRLEPTFPKIGCAPACPEAADHDQLPAASLVANHKICGSRANAVPYLIVERASSLKAQSSIV
jgi:hypothetical protein